VVNSEGVETKLEPPRYVSDVKPIIKGRSRVCGIKPSQCRCRRRHLEIGGRPSSTSLALTPQGAQRATDSDIPRRRARFISLASKHKFTRWRLQSDDVCQCAV